MIKNKNMLISINRNLIKFFTCFRRKGISLALVRSPLRGGIIFSQFKMSPNPHYSPTRLGSYFRRVYFEFYSLAFFASIVNCNFRCSCKAGKIFFTSGCTAENGEVGEGGGVIHGSRQVQVIRRELNEPIRLREWLIVPVKALRVVFSGGKVE